MAKVEIIGLDSLIQKLYKLESLDPYDVVKKVSLEVQARAKQKVHVDTGALKGSIRVDVKAKPNVVEGKVFTNLEYAPYVEFGTGAKGDGTYPYPLKDISLSYRQTPWAFEKNDKLIFTNGQVAQPFLYPAMLGTKKRIAKLVREEIKKEVK